MRTSEGCSSTAVLYNGEFVGKLYFVSERINALQQIILLHSGFFVVHTWLRTIIIHCYNSHQPA